MDTIVRVVARVAPDDVDELLRRIVFCVVCGNDDAHAKNWSLWYPQSTVARLAPSYDLVSTVEYFPHNDMSLKLAGQRAFGRIGSAQFRALADRTGLLPDRVDAVVREAVAHQVVTWEHIRERPEVYDGYRTAVDRHMGSLSLVREVVG